jgi:hypothetical protein
VPLAVEVFFIAPSKSIRYRNSHNLFFLADGKTLPFTGAAANYRSAIGAHGLILETTGVRVPYTTLLNLTRARKVAARIGSTKVDFTNNHLEALRELASLLAPSNGEWVAQEEREIQLPVVSRKNK